MAAAGSLKGLISEALSSGASGGQKISTGSRMATVKSVDLPSGKCTLSIAGSEKKGRMTGEIFGEVSPGQRVIVSQVANTVFITGIVNTYETTTIRRKVIDA